MIIFLGCKRNQFFNYIRTDKTSAAGYQNNTVFDLIDMFIQYVWIDLKFNNFINDKNRSLATGIQGPPEVFSNDTQ